MMGWRSGGGQGLGLPGRKVSRRGRRQTSTSENLLPSAAKPCSSALKLTRLTMDVWSSARCSASKKGASSSSSGSPGRSKCQ